MERSKDNYQHSLLASAVSSKNAVMFDAVMTYLEQDLSSDEVSLVVNIALRSFSDNFYVNVITRFLNNCMDPSPKQTMLYLCLSTITFLMTVQVETLLTSRNINGVSLPMLAAQLVDTATFDTVWSTLLRKLLVDEVCSPSSSSRSVQMSKLFRM